MDFRTCPEQASLRQSIATTCRAFGPSHYNAMAETGKFSHAFWNALAARGYMGVNISEEYGGGGGGLAELAIVCEETAAAGCPSLLLMVSSAISGELITRFGTEEQRAEWLPRLANGSSRMVFAITEPDAGSNSHQIASTATRDGNEYVLCGEKTFVSGLDVADAVLVVARTGLDAAGDPALSLFIVDAKAEGLVSEPAKMAVALPERQFTLFFEDVRVPTTNIVGSEGGGLGELFHGLNPERVAGAALLVGIGRYAIEKAADYASQRTVWRVPIGAHQGVSHPLAKAKMEVEAAALMTARAAWLHDQGMPAGEAANMAKYLAAEAALAAIDAAIQCHGGNGVTQDHGLIPLWGLARVLRIAPVSREMILNYVAQSTLGLPRSY